MNLHLAHDPRPTGSIPRSFSGCWTCRLRRKKCDEIRPVCGVCAALQITCHFDQNKPGWMDGGPRQEEMAARIKREVKGVAHRRRDRIPVAQQTTAESTLQLQGPSRNSTTPDSPRCHLVGGSIGTCSGEYHDAEPRRPDCTLTRKSPEESMSFGRSDNVLLMFYLEHLLPFLFPFYRPSVLEGGRAWVLEMMLSSPVVRQATLCQSSYFFALVHGASYCDLTWETILAQTRDAFKVLRQALEAIHGSGVAQHLHGAVRIFASIMQVQRFEISVLSFENCRAHLNAGVTLFGQILGAEGSNFGKVLDRLGPLASILPAEFAQVPSAEQEALRFSSALLIFDDIIASTVLQEQPRLYEYHRSLLESMDGTKPALNLEATVGCQNWVLVHIGEASALDAWKQQCKRDRNLNVTELANRATIIKDSLEVRLRRLETVPPATSKDNNGCLLGLLTSSYCDQPGAPDTQKSLATRVWAHAALLYLSVVVSGAQPANVDVRYHVGRIVELLMVRIWPPVLLRTMVWPFCMAGCLAEPAREAQIRGMVERLQPPGVFGTVCKALEIMENVWDNRGADDASGCDFAKCFKEQGDLVLLV